MMMICKNCKHCKEKRVGIVSNVYWCAKTPKDAEGKRLGVYPWYDTPHPKCPLKVSGK